MWSCSALLQSDRTVIRANTLTATLVLHITSYTIRTKILVIMILQPMEAAWPRLRKADNNHSLLMHHSCHQDSLVVDLALAILGVNISQSLITTACTYFLPLYFLSARIMSVMTDFWDILSADDVDPCCISPLRRPYCERDWRVSDVIC